VAPPAEDAVAIERVRPVLNAMRRELGLPEDPAPATPRDGFEAQLEAVLRAGPAVFSFTMGVLDRDRTAAFRSRGTVLIGTATTPDEGAALEEAGVDIVCAQGAEAGGHRGTFLVPPDEGLWGVLALVQQIVRRVRVPVLAAGGIMDGRGIAAALVAGASGVQLGTAFLTCPEAGTATAHRTALRSEAARRTVLSAAFSGRHGRAIANRYTDALAQVALPPFPALLRLTSDVRAAASAQGRADLMQLWAGQNAPLARELPAGQLVATLVRETNDALASSGALRLTGPAE
jgi:nitronate monooxygenase